MSSQPSWPSSPGSWSLAQDGVGAVSVWELKVLSVGAMPCVRGSSEKRQEAPLRSFGPPGPLPDLPPLRDRGDLNLLVTSPPSPPTALAGGLRDVEKPAGPPAGDRGSWIGPRPVGFSACALDCCDGTYPVLTA